VIENTGPVLDELAVAQLAQPFRRLGAQRTGSENGHGLGLSIVAAIAAAHGGSLRLHARRHGGLRIEIALPRATMSPTAPISA
jgi:signal transduction histidine kinase